MALNQTNRYVDLTLKEDELIRDGKHVLVAYHMKPKAGFGGYIETAAHFAAESSTGTNVEVSTTDAFTRGVDAIVYIADEERELIKLAYPVELFDRNITDGRAMIASFLTLAIGNNQGMGDVEYAKIHDFYFPPEYLRLFDGPADARPVPREEGAIQPSPTASSAPSSNRNSACGRVPSPTPATSFGRAVISSRMTNHRATRPSPR